MNVRIKRPVLAALVSLAAFLFTLPAVRADDGFAVESFTKYDREASSYTVPASVNFVVVKKASSDIVTLRWSNGWGRIYAILGSNDLEHWTEIEHTENWDAAIGGIPSFRDTKGLVENEEFVSFDTGYHFFKLRIKQR